MSVVHVVQAQTTKWCQSPVCSGLTLYFIISSGFIEHTKNIRASLTAQLVKNLPPMQETPAQFLGQEDPLEKGQTTHSNILGLPWWLRW